MTTPTMTRTDEQIQREMLAELNWDVRGVEPNEIGGVVKGGIVTLAGWVDCFTKKWAAEEAAHPVRGVKAVANEIEVRLPSSAERTDADIAAAVRTLQSDTVVPSDKIRVMLRGEVNWQFQKKAAERVVRRLAGVKGVSNLITLRGKPNRHPRSSSARSRRRWCAAPRPTPNASPSRRRATR
jgi:osmotically-inducible protein OsmY